MKNKIHHVKINLEGLICPDPIIFIRRKLRKMNKEDILLVITDDPTTKRDVPIFCHFIGHKLLNKNIKTKPYEYLIKKC
ncbi:Sulfur carrier protein TusA [Buchnera aphidicola (Eriosoma lanigerum)]|uniref:sulfurtransferase TusA n=1 Tax=Buchnera aphidicola TaxID=9 RepID=UPI0034639632